MYARTVLAPLSARAMLLMARKSMLIYVLPVMVTLVKASTDGQS